MKKLINILAAALIAFPLSTTADDSLTINGRFAWGPRFNQLSLNEPKIIKPHEADSGFIGGQAVLKAGNGMEYLTFRPGVELGLKLNDTVELTIGSDIEFNLDGQLFDAKAKTEMTDFEQQPGDRRSSGSGSFAYDKVYRDFLGVQPFVGLNFNTRAGRFTTEFSKPIAPKFNREWGHHRFDKEDRIGSESYTANGFAVRLAWTHPENSTRDSSSHMGIEVKFEKYSLGNDGDVTSGSLGIFTRF